MSQIHRSIFVQTNRFNCVDLFEMGVRNDNYHIKLLISLIKSKEFATMTQIWLRVTHNQHKHSSKVKLTKTNSSKLTNINIHRKRYTQWKPLIIITLGLALFDNNNRPITLSVGYKHLRYLTQFTVTVQTPGKAVSTSELPEAPLFTNTVQ
jgi:hypothetical protein